MCLLSRSLGRAGSGGRVAVWDIDQKYLATSFSHTHTVTKGPGAFSYAYFQCLRQLSMSDAPNFGLLESVRSCCL